MNGKPNSALKIFFLMLHPYYRYPRCRFSLSSGLSLESQCRTKWLFMEQVIMIRSCTNGAKHSQFILEHLHSLPWSSYLELGFSTKYIFWDENKSKQVIIQMENDWKIVVQPLLLILCRQGQFLSAASVSNHAWIQSSSTFNTPLLIVPGPKQGILFFIP